jgi:V-type H+-transporting ATPase subunit a
MKILMIAFICVPWLLFVKPFYLKYTFVSPSKSDPASHNLLSNDDRDGMDHEMDGYNSVAGNNQSCSHDHDNGEEFDFSEIFIHQAIETIEFVLGMISNTASYLRLWALSLAHTELAMVFWEKAMLSSIETTNPIMIFVGYTVFAVVTFGVLLAMDVLECFLHALRLHWVEFQNKFYHGDGYKFQPFDFKSILDTSLLE